MKAPPRHRLHPRVLADFEAWAKDPELGQLHAALSAHTGVTSFLDTAAEGFVARHLLNRGCRLRFEVPTPAGKHSDFEVSIAGQAFYLHVKRLHGERQAPTHLTISPRLRYLERIARPYVVQVRWRESLDDRQMERFVAEAAGFIKIARVGDELTVRDDRAGGGELGGVRVVAPWTGSHVSLVIGLPSGFVDEAPRIRKLMDKAYQQFMPRSLNLVIICSMHQDDVIDFQNALLGSHIERWDAAPPPGQRIAHGRAADGFWHAGLHAESVVMGWFCFNPAADAIRIRLWQRRDVIIEEPMQGVLLELFKDEA
jgi:hypothetical protein